MFGDSRAAQWPTPAIDGFHFINRGIEAQTSAQIAQRYAYHIEPLQADVLVLQLCINDLKTIPLFPKNKEAIILNCQNNLDQISQQAVGQGTIVILSTIMPVGQVPLERQLFWSDEVALAVDAVNLYIKSLASENVIVFDAFAILADENDALHKEFSRDELHLNSQGYAALNQEFEQLLRSLPDS